MSRKLCSAGWDPTCVSALSVSWWALTHICWLSSGVCCTARKCSWTSLVLLVHGIHRLTADPHEEALRSISQVCWWLTSVCHLLSNPAERLQACSETTHLFIDNVVAWMISRKLKLNGIKTEFLVLLNPQQLKKYGRRDILWWTALSWDLWCVRNLGVDCDIHLSMVSHVSAICRRCNVHFRYIPFIRAYISKAVSQTGHCSGSLQLGLNATLCCWTPLDTYQDAPQVVHHRAARLVITSSLWWKPCTSSLSAAVSSSKRPSMCIRHWTDCCRGLELAFQAKDQEFKTATALRSPHAESSTNHSHHRKACIWNNCCCSSPASRRLLLTFM